MASSEPDPANSSIAATTESGDVVALGDDSPFQCCVCLELLYKPIVLACGHISCFWCVHRAMHSLRESHCAICRQPYNHFPSICQLLHNLLLKLEPVAYKRREKEVLEEERRNDIYSPQFTDFTIAENHSEIRKSEEELETSKSTVAQDQDLSGSDLVNGKSVEVLVDDVLCLLCKEILYQPAVLNCGHVYCTSCLSSMDGEALRCHVCQCIHPGEFPNICLDLDHFLEEHFPVEYAQKQETVQLKKAQYHHGESSCDTSQEEERLSKSVKKKRGHQLLGMNEDLSNVHYGVGCDSCGMYPIIGKRYKCKDCTEVIGFDLCDECYNTSSKLPGRFNQQHTPDHKMEFNDSQVLSRILRFRAIPEEDPEDFVIEEFPSHFDPEGLVMVEHFEEEAGDNAEEDEG